MVASKNFRFADYQPFLQKLAEKALRLKEWTTFDSAVKQKAGVALDRWETIQGNVWFDFKNDVLWTLTEESQKTLMARLDSIRQKWALLRPVSA